MLDLGLITEKLRQRVPRPLEKMAKCAVLIPLIENQGQWEVIYELRAMDMKTQPGEVSFPGGGLEPKETFMKAAIRETVEELNIKEDNIEVLGELDYIISPAHMEIRCFLGRIMGIDVDKIKPNPKEVDHIFTVPLDFILNTEPKGYVLESHPRYNEEFPYNLIPGGKDYKFRQAKRTIYFYQYKDYTIWGFTASMTKHLGEMIKDL